MCVLRQAFPLSTSTPLPPDHPARPPSFLYVAQLNNDPTNHRLRLILNIKVSFKATEEAVVLAVTLSSMSVLTSHRPVNQLASDMVSLSNFLCSHHVLCLPLTLTILTSVEG